MTVGEANAFRLRLSRESRPRRRGSGLEMEDRPIYAATYRVGGGPVRHEPHPPHGWLKEVSLGQPAHATLRPHACRVEPETPDTALSVAQRAPGLLIHG